MKENDILSEYKKTLFFKRGVTENDTLCFRDSGEGYDWTNPL